MEVFIIPDADGHLGCCVVGDYLGFEVRNSDDEHIAGFSGEAASDRALDFAARHLAAKADLSTDAKFDALRAALA